MNPPAAFPHDKVPSQRRCILTVIATVAIPLMCAPMQSCYTPGTRARNHSTALNALAPAARQRVLQGVIQKGFDKDAVVVAWGEPAAKTSYDTPHGVLEAWLYTTSVNGYDSGSFGISRGWIHGRDGYHYDTDNFYPGPDTAQTLGGTASTDVPVKRVVFRDGRVLSYQTAAPQADGGDSSSATGLDS